MQIQYHTPQGAIHTLYRDMLDQPHLLIAGATGSGKSVAINGLIYTALYKSPASCRFVLVDPKRVELLDYAHLPHTIAYGTEPEEMVDALAFAMDIVEARYRDMAQKHVKKYPGGDCYVIIDELADLMTTNRRQVQPLLQRLAQVGRAAKVHIIAATQCPLAKVIPTEIKVNFDARLGLRTRSKQDSRNILEMTGCEQLPRYGQGYYMKPEETRLYNIPMESQEDINRLIKHWQGQPRLNNWWI